MLYLFQYRFLVIIFRQIDVNNKVFVSYAGQEGGALYAALRKGLIKRK